MELEYDVIYGLIAYIVPPRGTMTTRAVRYSTTLFSFFFFLLPWTDDETILGKHMARR